MEVAAATGLAGTSRTVGKAAEESQTEAGTETAGCRDDTGLWKQLWLEQELDYTVLQASGEFSSKQASMMAVLLVAKRSVVP